MSYLWNYFSESFSLSLPTYLRTKSVIWIIMTLSVAKYGNGNDDDDTFFRTSLSHGVTDNWQLRHFSKTFTNNILPLWRFTWWRLVERQFDDNAAQRVFSLKFKWFWILIRLKTEKEGAKNECTNRNINQTALISYSINIWF